MTLFWNILQSIITIFEIRVCVWMMENFAEPRFHGKKQKAVVWIVSLGVGGLYAANRWTTVYYSRITILIVLLMLFLMAGWMFVYHWRIVTFVAANYLLIGGLIDLIVMGITGIIIQDPEMFYYIQHVNDGYRIGVIIFSKILLFLCCWSVKKHINKKVLCQLKGKKIVFICILVCIIEYTGVHALTKILNRSLYLTYNLLIGLVLYLIVIFLLLSVMEIAILYYDKKEQIKQKNVFLDGLNHENQRMIRLYRDREKVYHDFRNHLLALDSFVHNGELEKYQLYMKSMREPFLEKPLERKTGHEIIDLILNYKINEAEKQGIGVKCEIYGYVNFKLDITDEDACSLMGNLWDNAIEACKCIQDEETWINFKMRIRPGKFLLEIMNPCREVLKDSTGRLITIKKDKNFHGIGMKTIRGIVERYNGYFNYVTIDHVFKVEIMICNE